VEFGTVVREKLTGYYDATEGFASTRTTGDQLLRVTDLASTCLLSLEEAHARTDDAVDWWRLKRFADALTAYKSDTGKMDFTDLLHKYVTEGQPLDIDVAIVDEAQDLTAAQWSVVRFAFSKANLIYVGGDDDQAIYSWAGADVRQFLTLSTTPEVLTQSRKDERNYRSITIKVLFFFFIILLNTTFKFQTELI
jgi:superfamily I DNA/RNA helicase